MLNWKQQLSKAWGGQDLSKDAYDYDKYYKDQPVVAWMQLYNIEANKWNPYIESAHFPDGGKSGLYKTPEHPTYPGLGNKSWSPDGSIYYLSNQQYMNPKNPHTTDDTLDYLGSDYNYNKGGTHVVYNGANVLPTLWVFGKKGKTIDVGFNLRSNKYDNGFEYKDRKQDIKIPYKQQGGLIQKYQQGKYVVPLRSTPTLDRKSWESEEDYLDRVSRYSTEEVEKVKAENAKALEQNKQNREKYLKSPEGKRKSQQIKQQDSAIFKNMKVQPTDDSSLTHDANLIQGSMNNGVTKMQTLGTDIKEAIKNEVQQRLDKWKHYKHGLDATLTCIELGLSGASLLGAYANWKKWETASSAVKAGIANFLQKKQLPMQIGGVMIDGYQTFDAIQKNDTFDKYWNIGSATLGTAGAVGASDVFRSTNFHSPKVDLVLDLMGVTANTGDFAKFGYDYFIKNE